MSMRDKKRGSEVKVKPLESRKKKARGAKGDEDGAKRKQKTRKISGGRIVKAREK